MAHLSVDFNCPLFLFYYHIFVSASNYFLPIGYQQKKNYERLQKALDSVMSIREMTQVFCLLFA